MDSFKKFVKFYWLKGIIFPHVTIGNYRNTGFFQLCPLWGDDTRWHLSTCREHGMWSLYAHGFGLRCEVIGPFQIVRGK